MTHYTGTLTLDGHEGYVEAPAVYELDVIWCQGEPYVSSVTLKEWTYDGRKQAKEIALSMLGDGEVQRQEADAVEAWLGTALRDMADERSDSREWLAAE